MNEWREVMVEAYPDVKCPKPHCLRCDKCLSLAEPGWRSFQTTTRWPKWKGGTAWLCVECAAYLGNLYREEADEANRRRSEQSAS